MWYFENPEIQYNFNIFKNSYPTLNVNISGTTDPIREISFRPDSPDQGLSNKPKIIENGSVDPEIFAFKYVKNMLKNPYPNFKRKYLWIY